MEAFKQPLRFAQKLPKQRHNLDRVPEAVRNTLLGSIAGDITWKKGARAAIILETDSPAKAKSLGFPSSHLRQGSPIVGVLLPPDFSLAGLRIDPWIRKEKYPQGVTT